MTPTTHDPIVVADVVLDAALAADADAVTIEADADRYAIRVARQGEVLAMSLIDATVAADTIARLGYIARLDPSADRAITGRTRIRSCDTQRDLVLTIAPGAQPRAELMFLRCDTKPKQVEPKVGDLVGHYTIHSAIGAGGMGSVYEVEHVALRRRAALKILQRTVIARDAESGERFLREAQATARIRSPHVVEVYDFGYLDDGRPYFVMELLAATTLADRLDHSALSVRTAITIARKIVAGLVAAHAHGVVHADVTPSNVLLAPDQVKLIDFGLAQLREHRSAIATKEITATPMYVSPEQLAGEPAIEASDQYSFGCVLFEMVAGRTPFHTGTTQDICLDHVHTPAPRVTSPYGQVPGPLAAVIARCLEKDPRKRYSSMLAVGTALEEVEVML